MSNLVQSIPTVLAYNAAAVKYFGEYACINEVPKYDPTDTPIVQKYQNKGGHSKYNGVSKNRSKYTASIAIKVGSKNHIGTFPDEKFAARIYDAAAILKFGADAIRHVNFPELLDKPLSLDVRYVFRAETYSDTPYAGVSHAKTGDTWKASFSIDNCQTLYDFPTAELAAEHYDKLVLIHRDNICTYLNFPEKLPQYLAEIGDQIISPKPIVIPDLT